MIGIALFVISGMTLQAQDDIQKVQEAWGKDKKELVRLGMELSAADSAKFWPEYDKYEKERQKFGRERILIIDDYAKNYGGLTNAKADELINRLFKNDASMTQLQQQYYNVIKGKINAIQAAKFLQIENYIMTTIRSELQDALPFIGELDSMKKG